MGLVTLHVDGRAGWIATRNTVCDWVGWSGRELQHHECWGELVRLQVMMLRAIG